ncbi:hypothetical protein LJR219_003107 [Phenylobacterium sp. LjRoot219]|uniref:hypothetical protein n=1 Tax=Phenylobacterium sp. LjRoot219 TaxID=3342283 RepID=UPI003ECDE942
MNAVTPVRMAGLVLVPDAELVEAVARTPLDQYVIWNGRSRGGRPNSVLTQALTCVEAVWTPIPLRMLLRQAARLSGGYGLRPEAVKKGLWSHQAATPACYFLVRATAGGEYRAVTDVPRPSSWPQPIRAGEVVLSPSGRLDLAVQAERPMAPAYARR